jgi:uncharacterized protein YndB with AHSA1/START domain
MATLEASWTVEIAAPRERCFQIAADVEGAPRWQGTLEEVETITKDPEGRPELVYTLSDAMVRKVKAEVRFSYDPPQGIRWEQEKGDAKSLTGYWDFEELDESKTRATYGLRTDPGRVLGMLLRGPVEGKVKELLTRSAAEGLKAEAEGD